MQMRRRLAMYRRHATALAISPALFTTMNGDTGTPNLCSVFIAGSLRVADQALRLAPFNSKLAAPAHNPAAVRFGKMRRHEQNIAVGAIAEQLQAGL